MNILTLLSELKDRNIHIGLQGDELRVSATTHAVTPDLVEQIRANKPALVRFLHTHREGGVGRIRPAPALESYPLTYAQRQLWLADQASGAGQAYNLSFRQPWKGPIVPAVLELALDFLVARHEILRTVFKETGGTVVQCVLRPGVAKAALAGCVTGDNDQFEEIVRKEMSHGFDLSVGPLLRVMVCSLSDAEHVLLFTLHHIIADAWSIPILLRELKESYDVFAAKRVPERPEPVIQYKDFAYWQQYLFPAPVRDAAKNFWLDRFSTPPVPAELRGCSLRPAVRSFRGRQQRLALDSDQVGSMRAWCEREGIKPFAFLIALFKTLAYRLSGAADLCVGIPLAGRIYPEIQQGIGYYVNMIALRTVIGLQDDFRAFCHQVDRQFIDAYSFQEYPFDQLIEDLAIPYDAARTALFAWMLNYERKEGMGNPAGAPEQITDTLSKFELEADFVEFNDTIVVQLRYNTDLFSDSWAKTWLGEFSCWFATFLANPLFPLREVLAGEAESVMDDRKQGPANPASFPKINSIAGGSEAPAIPVRSAGPTENRLIALWQALLPNQSIGPNGNFFAAGGHSLKAMQLSAAIFREFGISFPVRDIFRLPIIPEQAAFIDRSTGPALPEQPPAIPVAPDAEFYPVSAGQRLLWLAAQQPQGLLAYNMLFRRRWEGPFDADIFFAAWAVLLERHETLRTVFITREGRVVQRVLTPGAMELPVGIADGSGFGLDWLAELAGEAQHHAFALDRAPLWQCRMLLLANGNAECWITMHHMISDGWSMEVLFRDLRELYGSMSEGRSAKLPELRIQYTDYAVWQGQRDGGQDRQYWLERLRGELPVLELPADGRRPASRSFAGGYVRYPMGGVLLEQVRSYSRSAGCSEYTVLLAMVKLLLYRYSGQQDLIVGVPVAGRDWEGLQDQVGYYVNTLAIRSEAGVGMTVGSYIDQVRERLLEGHAHQWYPLDRIVEELGVVTEGGRNPLFDVMVNYERREGRRDGIGEEQWGESWAKFDLTFHFTQYDNELVLLLTYNGDLYVRERMERLAGHWQELTAAALSAPDKQLGAVEYIDEKERRQLLEDFQGRKVELEQGVTVVELFERQAERNAMAAAVRSGKRELTYGELETESNRLASHLRRVYGVGPNVCVGLMLERSERLIIGILGILKAGGAYVPIDPSYPEERRRYMAADSGMVAIVGEKDYGEGLGLAVVRWEERPWATAESMRLPERSGPEDLVYVIYTSGSTGRPKGVMITHRSLHNLCQWHARAFNVSEESRATLYAGIGFDASAWELWPYLLQGGTIYPLAEAERYQLKDLGDLYRGQRITHAFLPTPVCEELLQSGISLPQELCLLTGGDRLATRPGQTIDLYNNYGPTENTVVTTSMQIEETSATGPIPIGRPIDNTSVYILDAGGRLAGIGIYGELYIGGEGLAKGYIHNPTLTDERFPILRIAGEQRLYRSGDFGRWRADGAIEFAGRRDNQLKIRGNRVELGEIERAILNIPGVDRVRVLPEGAGAGLRLCGFFSGPAPRREVLHALPASLPAYMIPASCVKVTDWPLTPNGKIDDRSLLATLKNTTPSSAHHHAISGLEFELAQLWQQTLGVPAVGTGDHFFDRGGNSVKAIRLLSLIRDRWGVNIALKELYTKPVLAELASAIRRDVPATDLKLRFNLPACGAASLFLIPPVLGSSTIYGGLAATLAPSFRCIGLQYPGFEPGEALPNNLHEMATRFAEEILQEPIVEPVAVLGYSAGATLAFETVRLLEAAGLICRLILVDRSLCPSAEIRRYSHRHRRALLTAELKAWTGQDAAPELERIKGLAAVVQELTLSWKPMGNVNADILAIRASRGTQLMDDWTRMTSGHLTLFELDADHYGLIAHTDLSRLIREFLEAKL